MSQDADLRDLCNRFFDAIEARDMATIEDMLSPDLKFWANFTNQTKGRADILNALRRGYDVHKSRTYNDRRIRTFDHGFLMQFTCRIERHDGSTLSLWAALVAEVHDGKIVRIDEYYDSGKFSKTAEA